MACFLIVDDDSDNAGQLARSLLSEMGSAHEFACIRNLSDYRVWRREHRADLILVELMRHQSNGFSLAAALVRQSRSPVVLLSDRRQQSDVLWAAARGIKHVLSRCVGNTKLAQQLLQLLQLRQPLGQLDSLVKVDREPASAPRVRLSDLGSQQPESIADSSDLTSPPDALVILRQLIRERVANIYALLQSSPAVLLTSNLSATPCAGCIPHLCNALRFLPAAELLSAEDLATNTVHQFIWQIEKLLATESVSTPPAEPLPAGSKNFHRVLRTLRQQTIQPEPIEMCLILFTLGALPENHPMLKASLAARYGGDHARPESELMAQVNNAAWLEPALAFIAVELRSIKPVHQRLSTVMVGVYKLRVRLETSADHGLADEATLRSWQTIAACLYQYCCHCLLRTGVRSDADLISLPGIISDLRGYAQQGSFAPDKLLIMLAAAEVSAARYVHAGDGLEHQLLAAGLHRLPKPDGIVSALLDDVRQSGTSLSEICHELQLLTEGASRLGVARVESLSRLMQDCYQQLSREPELMQQKKLRLVLGRAHRVLCRLLDQAAAWRPLDEPYLESAAQKAIHELFLLFPQSRHGLSASQAQPFRERSEGNPVDAAAGWAHCQSINTRLRQLLRQSSNVNEYRSLMMELLREQQTLIAAYLRYQPEG